LNNKSKDLRVLYKIEATIKQALLNNQSYNRNKSCVLV